MNINLRTTLGDAKASRIPQSLGLCGDDDRFVAILNEAQQRLIPKGKWWGTVGKYSIKATAGVISLPREFAVVEKAALCHRPVPVHDFWFEFIANGAGTRDESNPNGFTEADYRGRFATILDPSGSDHKLRFTCDVLADVGQKVLVLGYDPNGNWIRSIVGGVWQDGELITLAQSPGTLSANLFAQIAGIQFPQVMNGQSWLYEWTGSANILLGNYQYNETRPAYARYFFPSIFNLSGGDTVLVEALAKREFIPALKDSDYLVIGCLPALKEMCQCIKLKEKATTSADYQLASAHEGAAVMELESELDHYLGTGRRIGVDVVGTGVADTTPIYNPM